MLGWFRILRNFVHTRLMHPCIASPSPTKSCVLNCTYSQVSAFSGSFDDSAVAPIHSRNYQQLIGMKTVFSVVGCIFITLTFLQYVALQFQWNFDKQKSCDEIFVFRHSRITNIIVQPVYTLLIKQYS